MIRSQIAKLDLSKVRRRVEKEHRRLSTKRPDAFEEEYRGFLFVNWKYPEQEFVPSKGADWFWHAHILHTRDYVRDCKVIFKKYFHHEITDEE